MYWSIDYYGSDPEKNNIEWGIAKKSEAWIFCRFKGGLDRKESRGCFWGGLIPQWTLCSFSDFTGIFFITLLRWNGCFIATVAAWGSITHLYPVLLLPSNKEEHEHMGQFTVQWKSQPTTSCQGFLSRPSFAPWQRKVSKMHLLCDRTLFYPSSLNFFYSKINYITAAY